MKKLLLITLLFATLFSNAQMLDTSFNTTGFNAISLANFADYPKGIHQQSSGKYIVTSVSGQGSSNYDYYAMRFNENGTLDTSFGNNGQIIANFGTGYDELLGSALHSDGRIILIGATSFNGTIGYGIVRLTVDGQFDTTFNTTGKLFLPLSGNAYPKSVTINSDDKIIISGRDSNGGMIIRLNEDGSFDSSLDNDGISQILSSEDFNCLAIDASQNIYVSSFIAGSPFSTPPVIGKGIVRKFTSSGTIDNSFGINGKATLDFTINTNPNLYQVALQNDGKILVLGTDNVNSPFTLKQFIARLNSNGTLDSSFNGVGYLYLDNMSGGCNFKIDNDNSIYVAGEKITYSPYNFTRQIHKVLSSGLYDSSFGNLGIYSETIPNLNYGFSVNLDAQNRLIVTAILDYNTSGMARYNLPTLTNSTFNFSDNIKIYPNPTSGNFNIAIDENFIGANVSVYNVLGQKVKSFSLEGVSTNQNLDKGMYILEIEKNGTKKSRKLIVQ